MADALADLDLLFAFEDLAKDKGWPVERDATDTRYSDATTQTAWEAFEAAHGPHGRKDGQQLYAEIKKSSKYACQIEASKRSGWPYPFPVRIEADATDYVVKGGIGGRYRLSDVNLYVIEDDRKTRIN